MSQSAFLAAALLAGLVLFIAARNRLKTYADVLFGPAPALPPFLGIPLLTVGGPPGAASKPSGGGGGGGSPPGPGDKPAPATDPVTGDVLTSVEDLMSSALTDAAVAMAF